MRPINIDGKRVDYQVSPDNNDPLWEDSDQEDFEDWTETYSPCSCCGMEYYPDLEHAYNGLNPDMGILVIAGEHGKEVDTPTLSATHVKTKQGVLTVVILPGVER